MSNRRETDADTDSDADSDAETNSDVETDSDTEPDADAGSDTDANDASPTNDGQRFDRLPPTEADRVVAERATRREVLTFWEDRFGIPPEVFEQYTFWERGKGKVWVVRGDHPSPVGIEALGMTFLRTRQEHWKPTTDAIQRFGRHAMRNVIELEPDEARLFVRGEDQQIERWTGDWGYLIAAHDFAGRVEPLGVGLFIRGELRSTVPKGRRRELVSLDR